MKLYKYEIDYNGKLVCQEERGFEEKEKTFFRRCGYPRRVNKERIGDIGHESMYLELWLQEKDDEKAKTTIRKYYQKKMESIRQECEQTCQEYQKIIIGLN